MSFECKNTVLCLRVLYLLKNAKGKKMQYLNLKFKNKAVRKNTKHYRYYEATSCFLRLEFISAGILYITAHKIKSGKAIGIQVLC